MRRVEILPWSSSTVVSSRLPDSAAAQVGRDDLCGSGSGLTGSEPDQPLLHAFPFTVKAVGSDPLPEALNPM
ncbi:hypothetical protein GCM10022267_54830 [Lentzea roselyniae]|uniref:Uncharacterized protein n=1 Tax=Lentzea roselyniae TaxID=531940 RepID=A0ABP7BIA5_9PSEU